MAKSVENWRLFDANFKIIQQQLVSRTKDLTDEIDGTFFFEQSKRKFSKDINQT